jgi:hypothetical protein
MPKMDGVELLKEIKPETNCYDLGQSYNTICIWLYIKTRFKPIVEYG